MVYSCLTHLGDIPVANFLKEYWQKKPLLTRSAFPHFNNPLSPEDLAGLSLEEEVVSRLVLEKKAKGESLWQTVHGPLAEAQFSQLPDSHWTLLVQHVDALHPEVKQLLDAFRFLPRWRLEDVMVSYASDKGSVGPHFDYYDVFLLQVEGKRRWQLGQSCSSSTPLKPFSDTKILAEFHCDQEWLLEPGDLLYIPPGVAHWGVAQGECITFSIGFRAPSHSEILLDYFTEMASSSTEDKRYSDANLRPQTFSGEISNSVIDELKKVLREYASDGGSLNRWFGEYMTRPIYDGAEMELDNFTPAEILTAEQLENTSSIRLAPNVRYAFVRETEQLAKLFVNGESWPCSTILAETLDGGPVLDFHKYSTADKKVLLSLADRGFLVSAESSGRK